jgi:NMD protein affecting ribosome stability and mRNA decay
MVVCPACYAERSGVPITGGRVEHDAVVCEACGEPTWSPTWVAREAPAE